MRKLSIICMLALILGISQKNTLAAPTYAVDDASVPGKIFVTEVTTIPGAQITLDIYLSDAPGPATTGGVWIDFSGSTDLLSYVSAQAAIPPWDPTVTVTLPEPGTILVYVLSSGGVNPDADGDIIICRVTFECTGPGDAYALISTIPGFTNWAPSPPYDDSLISPLAFTFHQECPCYEDADCPFNNNLWCDGYSKCEPWGCGSCIHYNPFPCDDANECTTDICHEAPTPGDTTPGTCSHECAATSGADLCCADLHATITLFAFVKLTSIVTRMLMRTTSLHF